MIPKTGYNESSKSYYVTVTVCVVIPKPGIFNLEIETTLNDLNIPAIFKVIIKIINKCSSTLTKPSICYIGYFHRCIHEWFFRVLHHPKWSHRSHCDRRQVPLVARWSHVASIATSFGGGKHCRHHPERCTFWNLQLHTIESVSFLFLNIQRKKISVVNVAKYIGFRNIKLIQVC